MTGTKMASYIILRFSDAKTDKMSVVWTRKTPRSVPRDPRGLMSAVKIFVDSSSLDRCRALVLPALDDLADVADLVSPHALMLASSPCRLLLSFPFPCVLPFSRLLFCKQVCSLPLLDEETTRIVHAMAIEEVSCTWRRFSQCCAWRQHLAVIVLGLW